MHRKFICSLINQILILFKFNLKKKFNNFKYTRMNAKELKFTNNFTMEEKIILNTNEN